MAKMEHMVVVGSLVLLMSSIPTCNAQSTYSITPQPVDVVRESAEGNAVTPASVQAIIDSFEVDEALLRCIYIRTNDRWCSLVEGVRFHGISRGKRVRLTADLKIPSIHVSPLKTPLWFNDEWLIAVTLSQGDERIHGVLSVCSLRAVWVPVNYDAHFFNTPTSKYRASKEEIFDRYLLDNDRWRAYLHVVDP